MKICVECKHHIEYRIHSSVDSAYGYGISHLCDTLKIIETVNPVTGKKNLVKPFGPCVSKNSDGKCTDHNEGTGTVMNINESHFLYSL